MSNTRIIPVDLPDTGDAVESAIPVKKHSADQYSLTDMVSGSFDHVEASDASTQTLDFLATDATHSLVFKGGLLVTSSVA